MVPNSRPAARRFAKMYPFRGECGLDCSRTLPSEDKAIPDANPARGVMLITGGSRGIGAATALLAAQAGYDVALLYRERADAAGEVVSAITAAGGRAIALRADVGDEAQLAGAFREVDAFGRLAVLVNNAGIIGARTRLEDLDAAMYAEVVRVNLFGAVVAAREAVRRMSVRRGGRGGVIVNVSSGAAVTGAPNTFIHYATTKGAMDSLTAGLSKEAGPDGIRVNGVRPGLIATDIQADRPPEQVERMSRGVPLGRFGTAREVAEAILWLASDAASYVNGAQLDVRGG